MSIRGRPYMHFEPGTLRVSLSRQSGNSGSRLHRAEFDDPLGSCFGHVNRPIAANRDIVNGVEHGIAGSPEADGSGDIPVAVELEDAGVFGIVVGAANSDVKEPIGIGVDTKDASCRLSVFCTGPLPLELANSVEQLKARVFAVGDEDVGTAGHEHEPVRITELTFARPLLPPFPQPFSVAVE